ncbi:MAG: CE1759 family FMN reductase [Actinomycetes bacterium]
MSSPTSQYVLLVTAGMGSPSSSRMLGDRLASATVSALANGAGRRGHTPAIRVLELRDLAVDLAQYYTSRVPSPTLQEAFAMVGKASGVIAVSPVLNAGLNGLFKLFFDLLDEGVLKGRPVLMAATGGTARHSLAIDQTMLPMFFYLKASVAPTAVFAATDDWGSAEAGLPGRIERAAAEFAELIVTRPASDHADEFADVPDFASLLGG